ncbi:FAD-binding protein [Frigidibacter sp. ROC022]|uniref:FAD-binding protein n=1 Tax=Frigidibacter sp. ROC022 TaxID=2971796 RepID=UPI00215B05BF|nr:FAD-binding protein [Frigidibacter sp. ROC022]MCR8722742.1 FAD-binding protein [Frigidibacter sp. ROC022]
MLTPTDETELAEALRTAQAPLSVRGGNTRGMAGAGEPLSVAAICGVRLYEPGALTVVAAAGTPLAGLEAELAAEGQRLAFEPMDHRGLLGTGGEPTIGGVVAANVSGPRRVQVGAARDFLLGLRFVDGAGTVIKNGGRVMKNVTGYDLARLVAGSRGALGVITEVALKVLPRPEAAATITIEVPDAAAAVSALSAALGSPYDVTGAAYWPGRGALVRIEGFAGSVAYRARELERLLAPAGAVSVESDADAVAALWRDIRDVAPFQGKAGDVWRLSVKPSDAPGLAARLEAESLLFDWGGGLIWALLPEGTDARARLGPFAGHATLMRAAPETRARIATLQPQQPAVEALVTGLRARFDPRGLFAGAAA